MKKYLLGFILGGLIIGSTVGVIAITFNGEEISYTTLRNANIHTVSDALDDLYTRSSCSGSNKLVDIIAEKSLTDGAILYHGANLTNGAADNSYRYTGPSNSVNNWICFGYDKDSDDPTKNKSVCKSQDFENSDYAYRIIGTFYINALNEDKTYVEKQKNSQAVDEYDKVIAAKIIKNTPHNTDTDYGNAINSINSIKNYTNEEIQSGYLYEIKELGWNDLIYTAKWKIGTVNYSCSYCTFTTKLISERDITTGTDFNGKIGLIYPSDYLYATTQDYWNTDKYNYDQGAKDYDWMYTGINEFTSKNTYNPSYTEPYIIYSTGSISATRYYPASKVRPTMYLRNSVIVTEGNGTKSNPYIVTN